ncbi:MAG: zinc-binding dehydrogenase [Candidatus Nitrosocaldus sp.]|nr:zinc-binding dehydrogenase [Candidatus Nitrosocaldus sp.]MDW7999511.1 zinc-binding dehydrogenase [Candidatus Nitrosocaldus sp.]
MRAVVLHGHGSVDMLRYQDFPEPVCDRGEVLVRVHACSVNRLDLWVRKGLPGREVVFPHILGCDISGYLASDSPDTGMVKGSRVVIYPAIHCGVCRFCRMGKENRCSSVSIIGGFSRWHGGYAEYVRVPARNIVPIPPQSNLSMDDAASINVAYLTVYSMLMQAGGIMQDVHGSIESDYSPSLLVYGAGSGIGVASIQLAKAMGYRVMATVGDGSKVERSYSLGCDLVIDRSKQDIVREVMNFTGDEGADLVIDHVGTWDTSIKCLRRSGVVAVCGATASEHASAEIRPFYNRLAYMFGAYLGSKRELEGMIRFMDEHGIRPVIDSVFALEDAMLAHARMEMNQHFGKILLRVADSHSL